MRHSTGSSGADPFLEGLFPALEVMGLSPTASHILIVDDNPFDRRIAEDTLRAAGHECIAAPGVAQAHDFLQDAPAVVLTDLVMPDGGGLEICRLVAAGVRPRPQLIVMSALDDERAQIEALETGADDYVVKPLNHAQLVARVRVGIRSYRERTATLRAETQVREQEAEVRDVLDAMTDGLAVVDPGGVVVIANPSFCRITGWGAHDVIGAGPPYPWWPEADRCDATAAHERARKGAVGEAVVTLCRPDGSTFPAGVHFSPRTSDAGRLQGHVVSIRDLTERVRLEERLRRSEAEQRALRRVAESVARGMGETQVFGLISRQIADLLGVECGLVARFDGDEAVVVGGTNEDRHHSVGARLPLHGPGALARVRREGRCARVVYRRLPDQTPIRRIADSGGFTCSVAAPVDVNGERWGAVLASTRMEDGLPEGADIQLAAFAELLSLAMVNAATRQVLLSQAQTDPLTGLENRRTFERHLVDEVKRARRDEAGLCLVLIDIDHFKAVNDEFGHPRGDAVLVSVARQIEESARSSDHVARIGGEEFAWILADTRPDEAAAAAERMRRALARSELDEVGNVTISAGLAALRPQDRPEDLLQRADSALYAAKAGGRNAVHRGD